MKKNKQEKKRKKTDKKNKFVHNSPNATTSGLKRARTKSPVFSIVSSYLESVNQNKNDLQTAKRSGPKCLRHDSMGKVHPFSLWIPPRCKGFQHASGFFISNHIISLASDNNCCHVFSLKHDVIN